MTPERRPLVARLFEVAGTISPEASSGTAAWSERRGLLLELSGPEGRIGQGEAAPLPGYSPDTLEQAREQLLKLDWAALPEIDRGGNVVAQVERALEGAGLASPAARFAAESALLDLAGQRVERPVHRLLSAEPSTGTAGPQPKTVPLAALLSGDVLAEAKHKAAQGYLTFKVKIGRSPAEELALLASLRAELGDEVALRADANGSLAPENAPRWLRWAADLNLEFVEEPVALEELLELPPSPVPLAVDETLCERSLDELLETRRYRYVVLKPGLLGGIIRCLRLAERARAVGAEPVVSHLFDGPVALAAAAELALALGPSPSAGLAPHAGLTAWPAVELSSFGEAELVPHRTPGLGLPRLAEMERDVAAWQEVEG